MDFFDLHCDTITECLEKNENLEKNSLAVDLEKGKIFDKWVQTFAFWIPDELKGEKAYKCFKNQYDFAIKQNLKQYGGNLQKGCNAFFAVEGGHALGGSLEKIEELRKRNIKILTLTWNGENEIASGAQSIGGLKPFGKEAIKDLEEAGIFVDVSHLNQESFWDVQKLAKKPFLATHSNAYSVYAHPRNLKDDQIKAIKDSGGIMGINFFKDFLSEKCDKGIPELIKHIDHFLKLGCEDCLAIGSDFDGAEMPKDLLDIKAIAKLRQSMLKYYGKTKTNKIMFENANDFFKQEIFS